MFGADFLSRQGKQRLPSAEAVLKLCQNWKDGHSLPAETANFWPCHHEYQPGIRNLLQHKVLMRNLMERCPVPVSSQPWRQRLGVGLHLQPRDDRHSLPRAA